MTCRMSQNENQRGWFRDAEGIANISSSHLYRFPSSGGFEQTSSGGLSQTTLVNPFGFPLQDLQKGVILS